MNARAIVSELQSAGYRTYMEEYRNDFQAVKAGRN